MKVHSIKLLKDRSPRSKCEGLSPSAWLSRVGSVSLIIGAASIIDGHARDVWNRDDERTRRAIRVKGDTSRIEKRAKAFSTSNLLTRQSDYRLPGQKRKFDTLSLLAGTDNCPGTPIPAGTYTAAAPFTDSGNTTGANSTIHEYGYYQGAYGPDHIYTFTITSLGPNPKIEISTTSTTFNVSAYILNGLTYGRCPAGTDNYFYYDPIATTNDNAAGGTETFDNLDLSRLPRNVPLHLFVDSQSFQPADNAGPYTVKFEDVTIAASAIPPANNATLDMDGSGKSDLVIARNTGGQITWFTRTSDDQFISPQNWGVEGDKFVPADYDGDGRDDIAVWRPGPQGRFFIIGSRTQTFYVTDFGQTGDDPSVVADYTGDGVDDLAVYRPGAAPGAQSYWFYRSLATSPDHFTTVPWGQNGDRPVSGDFDAYGGADFVVQRADGGNGRFYVRLSSGYQMSFLFGMANDLLVPFNHNVYSLLTIVRPGPDGFLHWFIRGGIWPGDVSYSHRIWGVAATDIPAPGDYDGDGVPELAVWRPGSPGVFFSKTISTGAITVKAWGETGDMPAASFGNH